MGEDKGKRKEAKGNETETKQKKRDAEARETSFASVYAIGKGLLFTNLYLENSSGA